MMSRPGYFDNTLYGGLSGSERNRIVEQDQRSYDTLQELKRANDLKEKELEMLSTPVRHTESSIKGIKMYIEDEDDLKLSAEDYDDITNLRKIKRDLENQQARLEFKLKETYWEIIPMLESIMIIAIICSIPLGELTEHLTTSTLVYIAIALPFLVILWRNLHHIHIKGQLSNLKSRQKSISQKIAKIKRSSK